MALLRAATAMGGEGGFLFVTFKGEQTPMTEQIYFAVSVDGRHWDALNDSQPVLVSTLGEKGVRDPAAVAAKIGVEKYGKKGMAAKAHGG